MSVVVMHEIGGLSRDLKNCKQIAFIFVEKGDTGPTGGTSMKLSRDFFKTNEKI